MNAATFSKYCIPSIVIIGGLDMGWSWPIWLLVGLTWLALGMLVLVKLAVKYSPALKPHRTVLDATMATMKRGDLMKPWQRLTGLLISIVMLYVLFQQGWYLTFVASAIVATYAQYSQVRLRQKLNAA
jgi:hypothetical protein